VLKNREFLPEEIKPSIHYAHVHSHIEFVSPYLQLASVNTRNRTSAIQKKCIRHIMQIKLNGHREKHFQNLGIIHRFNIYIDYFWTSKILILIMPLLFFYFFRSLETQFRNWFTNIVSIFEHFYDKQSSCKLPLFHYPSVFNAILTQDGMSPVDQLIISLLIQDYVNSNSCTGVHCWSCQYASYERPKILRKIAINDNGKNRWIKKQSWKNNWKVYGC